MAGPQRWLVVVILMMCAVSHLCIADEQLIDLNGEKSDDLLSRHSEGMSEVFEEGPLGGVVTNSAPASELPLESANKDSNAKSEVLGAKSEVLGDSEGDYWVRRLRRRRAPLAPFFLQLIKPESAEQAKEVAKALQAAKALQQEASKKAATATDPAEKKAAAKAKAKADTAVAAAAAKQQATASEPGSVMHQNTLERGVTCGGAIPKACYSVSYETEPGKDDKCIGTKGEKLKVTKVAVYAVDPKAKNCNLQDPKAKFWTAKLELKNVQCECPSLGACYNIKYGQMDMDGKTDKRKVIVQMDSKSTATIGGKSLASDFKFNCYVAALQQVMDRAELEASAKEQVKAYAAKKKARVFVATPRVQIKPVGRRRGTVEEESGHNIIPELGEETAGRRGRGNGFSSEQKFSLIFANRAGNAEELEELDDLE